MPNSFSSSLLAAAASLLVACNSDQLGVAPVSPAVRSRASASAEPPQGALVTAYTQTFVRHAGKPDSYVESLDLSHYEGEFVMTVTNGDGSGNNRIHAGSVSVDGVTFLDNRELGGAETTFTFTLAGAPQAVAVTALGAPNGFLRIELKGHDRRWRVCPGENFYRTYATMQEAVTAADPGVTIWVCDGTHYAAAVIEKPVTIRPEHYGAVTLRDTLPWSASETSPNAGGPSPAFTVSGLASGTFRVTGFKFILQQSAILMTNTWARVEVDSSNFEGSDSTHVFAVRSFSSTTPGATLDIRQSSFTRMKMAVLAAGGVVNVSESSFQNISAPMWFTEPIVAPGTGATGRVEASFFTSCEQLGCIRVNGRGGVSISKNTFRKDAGTPPGMGVEIDVPRNLAQLPTVVENNDFIGSPASGSPLNPRSWSMISAVDFSSSAPGTTPSSTVVRGNRITDAGFALAFRSANGSVFEAYDNAITNSFEGVRRNSAVAPNGIAHNDGTLVFRRNDVVGATQSFSDFGAGPLDLTCNWWGSTAGPFNMVFHGSASVYTPWAMAPIANRSTVSCQ
jgi:hypothetical protein